VAIRQDNLKYYSKNCWRIATSSPYAPKKALSSWAKRRISISI